MVDPAGAAFSPPRSLIVVHGVGDQARGQTGRDLAEAVGRELIRELGEGTTVTIDRRGDILRAAPVAAGDEDLVRAEVVDVDWREDGRDRSLPIYEFYWADESRVGEDLVGRWLGAWQLFVGLPRLGLYALSYPAAGLRGLALRVARGLYGLAWIALVLRLLAGLIIASLGASVGLDGLRQAELSLPLDLATSLAFLLLVMALTGLKLASRGRSVGGRPAVLALTVAALITQVVPLAVAERGRASWADAAAVRPQEPARRWLEFPNEEVDARWFYAVNTLPGFWPYVEFGLVVAWALAVIATAAPLFVRTGGPLTAAEGPDPRVAARIGRMLRRSRRMGSLIAISVLVISPLLDWHDFLRLLGGDPPPTIVDPRTDRQELGILKGYCDAVVVPFVLIVAGLLFSSRLRVLLAPLVELALDVMNYLPPFPRLDARAPLRVLLGGRQDPRRAALVVRLRARLRALIDLARERHGGPVLVVAHSLGTMIALDALDDWPGDGPAAARKGEAAGPSIDLITMGSPLVMLAGAYPHLFGAQRSGGVGWRFSSVRTWRNDYRDADLIGRALLPGAPPIAGITIADGPLGRGGHVGYFSDAQVARRLLGLVRGPSDSSGSGITPGGPAARPASPGIGEQRAEQPLELPYE
jgi:hypothetical protein